MCGNWAASIMAQDASLGMPYPFSSSGIDAGIGVQANMEVQQTLGWFACIPKDSPIQGAKRGKGN